MPKQRAYKAKNNTSLLSKIKPNTPLKQILLFVLIFALAGGGYMLARSSASTGASTSSSCGDYVALNPSRIFDSRNVAYGSPAQLLAGTVKNVPVASNREANEYVFSVTVINPTDNGFVTVYPSDTTMPATSNINYRAGQNITNQVIVSASNDNNKSISFYNSAGKLDYVVDTVGYFKKCGYSIANSSRYQSINPIRVHDGRQLQNTELTTLYKVNTLDKITAGKIGPKSSVAVSLGQNIESTATSAVVNITAVNPEEKGYATVWSGVNELSTSAATPSVSNVTFSKDLTTATLVTTKINWVLDSAKGIKVPQIAIYNNSSGASEFIVDLVGYYNSSNSASTKSNTLPQAKYLGYSPQPMRIYDSRKSAAISSSSNSNDVKVKVTGFSNTPSNATSVVLNVVCLAPISDGFLTVWSGSGIMPPTSNLNCKTDRAAVANQVVVPINKDGTVQVHSYADKPNIVVDLVGYYYSPSPSPTETTLR